MPLPYNKFVPFYPPRIENKLSPEYLPDMEGRGYMFEPKFNGSSCMPYLDGAKPSDFLKVMDRHKTEMVTNFKMDKNEFKQLHRGNGWLVLSGEYMNKGPNATDENGKVFQHKYIIYDILVYEGRHLNGTTFRERYELLQKLYGGQPETKPFLSPVSGTESIYLIKAQFDTGVVDMFNQFLPYTMYEGVVGKHGEGRMEKGDKQNNTTRSQFKVRKPHKNFTY